MAKKQEHGFEVNSDAYGGGERDLVSDLAQAISEIPRETPSGGFIVKRQGDRLMIEYQMVETYLHDRGKLDGLVKEVEKLMREYVSNLKKAFKKISKQALKLKEVKGSRGFNVDKISLNDRWYLRVWCSYEVGPAVTADEVDGD
jgi:hypothetical protein